MKTLLQKLLPVIATAVALNTLAADPWPAKPSSILVPYPPGGTTDVVARIYAKHFTDTLKQGFLVENKPGASGTIAMAAAAKSAPDGYTLYASEMTMAAVPALFDKLTFDTNKDFTHIALVAEAPYVLVVNAKVPANTLKELIALAKQQPGKLNFATGGSGSGPHLAAELFKSLAGVDINHIPYKGSGPAVNDLIGGQVEMMFTAAPTVAGHIAAGRVKAIAVTANKRLNSMPNVQTAPEAGLPGLVVANWFGISAPKGTPAVVSTTLNAKVVELLKNPETVAQLDKLGAVPAYMNSDEYTKYVLAETNRWTDLIRKHGIKQNN
jgi:tripartite-type tricarboxylate transporter receptor subunit TctC